MAVTAAVNFNKILAFAQENQQFGFPTMSDTNRLVESQKKA